MKRPLFFLGLLAIGVLGCSLFTGATQPATAGPELIGTARPEASEKPGATNEPATLQPAVKAPLSRPTNSSCNELAFFLDYNLAASIKCFKVPETGGAGADPFATNPPYSKVTLVDYHPTGRMMQPIISIFPVQRYSELLPDVVQPDVTALQALIAGSTPGSTALPILPVQNAQQLFFAQFEVLHFQNGAGVRYITQYSQSYVPPNSHDLFYSFQGLTSDGKYWVSVILPTTHPSLWATAGSPTNTEYSTINKNPDAYYAEKTGELDALQPRSFVPSLEEFDALVQSIIVKP